MRYVLLTWLLLGVVVSGSAAAANGSGAHHQLTAGQARRIAMLLARHDHIDLSDTHIEFNSMDLTSAFIPGYASFIVIRESSTPGPDETLHRYAVNRRTGDAWEMTLCTHYDFPELSRLRRALTGSAATVPSEVAAQSRQLGCADGKRTPGL